MPLLNTTEIPLDDDVLALETYTELFDSEKILMIVLGVSDSIQEGVELADELADTSPTDEDRHVIWIKNHVVLKEQIEPILHEADIIEDDTPYEEIKAFCLTRRIPPETPRKALSRVHKNGEMDFVRLEDLFVESEGASIDS